MGRADSMGKIPLAYSIFRLLHVVLYRLFMLLFTIGLTIMSWVLLAFMGGCDGVM